MAFLPPWKQKSKPRPPSVRLLALLGLFVVVNLYFIKGGSTHRPPSPHQSCEKGLLTSTLQCKQEESATEHWKYSVTVGGINAALCDRMSRKETPLPLPNAPDQKLALIDCGPLQLDNTHFCYASQRKLGQDQREFMVFLSQYDCGSALFFHGTNNLLLANRPTVIPFTQKPYRGIPELEP